MTRLLPIALAVGVCLFPALSRASPEQRIDVSVLTMGPGDLTFSKFGHDAIVVAPPRGRTRVYNFGTFTLNDPHIVSHFLHKKLQYWLSVSSLDATIEDYAAQNRSVLAQDLALDPAQARTLAQALAVNARPENRFYAYDYFDDNCSTRVRDALDTVLGGALRRAARPHASLSFRDHALRLASDDLPLYLGLDFGLGGYADRPQTEWDELFLPEKVAAVLRRVRVVDTEGRALRLVRSERVLFAAHRAPLPERPPQRTPLFLAVGLALAAALSAMSLGRERPARRVAFGVSLGLLGTVLGTFGALLAFFWVATAHHAAWANLNLAFAPPWLVAAVGLGPAVSLGSRRAESALSFMIVATAVSTLVGLVLLPFVAQHSERIAALLAPSFVALAAIEVVRFARQRR